MEDQFEKRMTAKKAAFFPRFLAMFLILCTSFFAMRSFFAVILFSNWSSIGSALPGISIHHSLVSSFARLYPQFGLYDFDFSSQTMRSFFFFLIPFNLANSCHFVSGLSFGIGFSLGKTVVPAGNFAM